VITRIEIENFRCVRSLGLDLAPLTALVGPNGSGKSALLAALAPVQNPTPSDVWQHQTGIQPHITAYSGSHPVSQIVIYGNGSHSKSGGYTFQLLRLDLAKARLPNTLQPAQTLSIDGSNLANVFGTLTRKQQTELAQQICSLIPLFTDVDDVPVGGGTHQLRYQDRWNPSVWYTPHEVSDGTILLTSFLTLQYQTPPVSLVAIEEPERGLHPYLLEQLVGFLRGLSRGEGGRAAIQVVLATHSPELLEYLEPQEVRFVGRDAKTGSTTVKSVPSNDPDWPRYFAEYRESLREAWLSGSLGGVPGA